MSGWEEACLWLQLACLPLLAIGVLGYAVMVERDRVIAQRRQEREENPWPVTPPD